MGKTHEPSDDAVLSARLMRAYPSLSPFSCASLAASLVSIERAQRRHVERQCNGPRDRRDGPNVLPGYFKLQRREGAVDNRAPKGMEWVSDPDAERRAGERIANRLATWENKLVALHDRGPANLLATAHGYALPLISLESDPSGRVLLLRLPGETEASSV